MKYPEAHLALGERINALREAQKLSVRNLALMVGLSKDYIVDLEKGRKSPTFETIMKLCAGLDIAPKDLVNGIENPNSIAAQGPGIEGVTTINYHATRF